MDDTKSGATSSHEGGLPKTNNFSDKVTESSRYMQISPAFNTLMNMVDHPSEPSRDKNASGMLRTKTANQWTMEASQRPDPTPLWLSLWYEGEVCCLFADSNLGKSIYAVQIASAIAQRQKVIYFDFELSDKQFQLRYSDDEGNLHQFSDNLLRSEIDPDLLGDGNFEDEIISDIERAALQLDCKVLIVDNITYLCSVAEKADAASVLMIRLLRLKKKYGLSLLVLAHTPKRPLSSPITQNDLAGSKKLFNFFDSVFSIGKSAKDENLRYIKQIKCRAGAFEYGSENVIVSEIIKTGSWLHFRTVGFATEREHLREYSDNDTSVEEESVKELAQEGKSQRQIASTLGISVGKVNKVLKKVKRSSVHAVNTVNTVNTMNT